MHFSPGTLHITLGIQGLFRKSYEVQDQDFIRQRMVVVWEAQEMMER
jgi:hypothetical protein